MDFEIRSGDGLHALSRGKVGGYAARFNSPSCDLGGFTEIIRPGAFTSSLRAGLNIRALYHHDDLSLLGTTQAGTLRLREDDSGLAFELDLPDTSYGRDVAVLVERGDIAGCSFGFRVEANGDFWEERAGAIVRELRAVNLHEITLTHDPAYRDTTVAKRSMPGNRPRDLRALWLETL